MRPPGLAVRLVTRRLPAQTAEFVLGDLEEGFYARGRRRGPLAAAAWYWSQALRVYLTLPTTRVGVDPMPTLKQAARMLAHRPLFAATVIITLALAIGANAVIFGMVDMLLFRPLPIAEPDRVVRIFGVNEASGTSRSNVSTADFFDYRDARVFSHLSAFLPAAYTMTGRGDARRLQGYQMTPSLFDVWGLDVVHGRRLGAEDGQPGAVPVVLLAHTFWVQEFGARPEVVGQVLHLSGTPHVIVGILGPEMEIGNLAATKVWTPFTAARAGASRDDRGLVVMGLLAPGAALEQADAEVKAVAARIREAHPATHAAWSARAVSVREGIVGEDAWLVMTLLVLTVFMVLLIACANVTNILLAGLSARGRELAVRAALGATRRHLVTQLLAEASLLAVAGGLLGLAVGYGGIKALSVLAQGNFFFDTLTVDLRMAIFVLALSFVAPVLFALVPAMQSSRPPGSAGVNEMGTRLAGTRRGRRLRSTLVVAQIAFAMMLMVVSALAVRSMVALLRVDLGFNHHRITIARFEAPAWKFRSEAEVRTIVHASLERLRALPGASGAAVASAVAALDREVMRPLEIEGAPLAQGESRFVNRTIVGDGYFETLGLPIIAGRAIDARDGAAGAAAAVVSRTMADRYLGGAAAAVGRRIRMGEAGGYATVVGVSGDVANSGANRDPEPVVYLPFARHPQRDVVALIASPVPAAVSGEIRAAIRDVDGDIAVDVATYDALMRQEFSDTRALIALFTAFGGVALALAASGLYGVIAFVVAQRTREFGVRVALGAAPSDVGRLMLSEGGALVSAGLAIGLGGAIGLAQLTRGTVLGVSVSDPLIYLAVAVLVALPATLAAYIPARRAMRLNPVEALRAE